MSYRQDALDYHSSGRGRIAVAPTRPASTQRLLSLACSPGVADPCREIARGSEAVEVAKPHRARDRGRAVGPGRAAGRLSA